MQVLEDADKKQFKEIKVDSKQFTSNTMGLAQKRDPNRKRMIGAYANQENSEENDLEMSRKPTVDGNETLLANQRANFKKYTGPHNLKLILPKKVDKVLERNQSPNDFLLAKTRFKV